MIDRIRPAMPAAYLETLFEATASWANAPRVFAMITAYATTGEEWPDEVNQEADGRLEHELRQKATWVERVTGYSPTTGHREPGWAVDLDFETACDMGLKYRQDAIYMVIDGMLSVSFCDSRRRLVHVGDFWSRLRRESGR